jgi:hypothetical protein
MAKPTGNPNGRPSLYTDELAKEICNAIRKTSKGLKTLCKENEHWPDDSTIRDWIMDKESFASLYARAKMQQADFMVEELMDISDDGRNDYYEDKDGNLKYAGEHVQRSRLRVDTRKWVAAKLAPKVYSERVFGSHEVKLSEARLEDLK